MYYLWRCSIAFVFFCIPCVFGLSLRKDESVVAPPAIPTDNDECDPSTVPVMDNFDIKKFSGDWYELAKSASGYIDVDDGMWKILTTNNSTSFLYSGRDNNGHCIRPIRGKIHAVDQPPGLLTLKYQTYSTIVEENIRVLFTDYTTIAVIYLCMHHIHKEKEVCHAAGLMGAVWTRKAHVELEVYDSALIYLEMACVHKSILTLRNLVGPCRVDNLGFRIDDFPVPDFCYQPKDLGFCRGSLQRYYYDPQERTCKIFTYGGCDGNKNNFMSLPECQEKCLNAVSKDPVCLSVAKCAIHCSPCCTEDRNGCVECNCDHIVEDNFQNCVKSPAYCQPECAVEDFYPGCYICSCHEENEPFLDTPACLEVKATGYCNDNIERYYYNIVTEECEKFIYSGCNGNKNNFESLSECEHTCKVTDPNVMKAEMPNENDDAARMECYTWIIATLIVLQRIVFSISMY